MCRTKVADRFAYSVWFLPCETGIGLSTPGEINFSSEMEHARASLSHYLRHQWCIELSVYFQTSDSHRLSWQSGDVSGTALRSFRRLPEPSSHLPGNRIHTATPSPLSLSSLLRKKCKTKKTAQAAQPTSRRAYNPCSSPACKQQRRCSGPSDENAKISAQVNDADANRP